jgi:transcription elongation factor GreB
LQANDEKKPQQYQIVGVDEANITKGKISFLSPLARLLMHKKVGNKAVLKLGARNRVFEVLKVEYVL